MVPSEEDCGTLDKLKAQLDFIEKGGYRQPGHTPWRPPAIFLDSPTCLDFAIRHKGRPCNQCVLMRFVPNERRKEGVPCHHIPLTEAGDTVKAAEAWADEEELEDLVKAWLRRTIAQLEETLPPFFGRNQSPPGDDNENQEAQKC